MNPDRAVFQQACAARRAHIRWGVYAEVELAIQYPLTEACGFACTTKHWARRRAALRRWQMQGGWRGYQDRNGRDPRKSRKRPQVRRLQVPQGCRQKLTLGCPVLDRLLRGGIPTGLITELAGAVLTDLLLQRSIMTCMLEFLSHRPLWALRAGRCDHCKQPFQGRSFQTAGEAAAAKTQTCLQLLLNAQLPLHEGGFDGSAL